MKGATDQIRHTVLPQLVRRPMKDTERAAAEQIVKWRRRSHFKQLQWRSLPTLLHVVPDLIENCLCGPTQCAQTGLIYR